MKKLFCRSISILTDPKPSLWCLVVTVIAFGSYTSKAQLVVDSSDQGHISVGPYGVSHDSSSQNYQLGSKPMTSFLGIPYFVFDIPDLVQTIESVTLSIYNPGDVYATPSFLISDQGFQNDAPAAEISLWNYLGDKSVFDTDFNTGYSPPDVSSIWDDEIQDLQSGTRYGAKQVDSSSDGTWIDFYLNSEALIDIWTSQGGKFALGAKSENNSTMFHSSGLGSTEGEDYPSARLEFFFSEGGGVAVPEPSTYGIIGGIMLAGCIMLRIRKRRA